MNSAIRSRPLPGHRSKLKRDFYTEMCWLDRAVSVDVSADALVAGCRRLRPDHVRARRRVSLYADLSLLEIGVRFGPAELTGGPETPGAIERLGEILRQTTR